MVQAISIFFTVVLFAILVLPGVGLPANTLGARIATVVVFFLVLECVILGLTSVRYVELDSRGVTFRFPFHDERVPWGDLEPWNRPVELGAWWVSRPRRSWLGVSDRRSYTLTIEQARTIVSFPAHPPWVLPPEVLKSLGLESARL
jgi:hypothetical protein